HELLVELRRHGVAAGNAAGLAQRRLGAPLVEVGAIMLLEIGAIITSDGQGPVAKRFARVALAAGAEQCGNGVTTRLALSVGEGLQRLLNGLVEALLVASEG